MGGGLFEVIRDAGVPSIAKGKKKKGTDSSPHLAMGVAVS
jgi:hypothetical protein